MAKTMLKEAPRKVSAVKSEAPAKTSTPSGESFTRDEWVSMARKMLIRDGIAGVKIDRLAKRLGVTRGGFYWRFKGQTDLLDALLENWRATNTRSTVEAVQGDGTPVQRFTRLMHVWVDEIDFDPAYDLAVRDWARVSPKADKAVRKFDGEFVDALSKLFLEANYPEDEALIRARIVYYHQIGYYALRVKQTRESRYQAADLYLRILTGFTGSFLDGGPPSRKRNGG